MGPLKTDMAWKGVLPFLLFWLSFAFSPLLYQTASLMRWLHHITICMSTARVSYSPSLCCSHTTTIIMEQSNAQGLWSTSAIKLMIHIMINTKFLIIYRRKIWKSYPIGSVDNSVSSQNFTWNTNKWHIYIIYMNHVHWTDLHRDVLLWIGGFNYTNCSLWQSYVHTDPIFLLLIVRVDPHT